MRPRATPLRAMPAAAAVAFLAILTFGCSPDAGGSESVVAATTSATQPSEDIAPTATQETDSRQDFLDVIVPPCTPFPGSDVNPCERRDTWPNLQFNVEALYEPYDVYPSYEVFWEWDIPWMTNQFALRGIAIPGTTRCGTTQVQAEYFALYKDDPMEHDLSTLRDYAICYTDVAVNEYLVGKGPSRLTIENSVKFHGGFRNDQERQYAEREVGSRFEGSEWVMILGHPLYAGGETWALATLRDIQLLEDGRVVVVSAGRYLYDDDDTVNIPRVEMLYERFKSEIKAAHAKFFKLHGGRIGPGTDGLGNPLPFYASEATLGALREQQRQWSVLEHIETQPYKPPPIPGEGDPDPSGLTINDVIATRVAGAQRP